MLLNKSKFENPKSKITESVLKDRTRHFALRIMQLVDALPQTTSGRAIASQLVRAATSVGANYRAACRGRSKAEFIAKLGIVVEEADECSYWLELIADGHLLPKEDTASLQTEAAELTAIMVASIRTTQFNQKSKTQNPKPKIKNQKSKI